MLSHEIMQKMRCIEIQTRRLLSGSLVGDYSSAQKGSGLDFDQIRAYQMGDDIRFIDWKASARSDTVLVKQYREDRSRTVIIALDTSASLFYGSSEILKMERAAEVASVFALVSLYGKDYVGALTFSDHVEKIYAPGKTIKHIHAMMETFFSYQQRQMGATTSLETLIARIMQFQKQQAIVILVSDFIDSGYEKMLTVLSKKHEVIAVRCLDNGEKMIPAVGFIPIVDPETGYISCIQSNNFRINHTIKEYHAQVEATLRKCGADVLDIPLERSFVGDIIRFFRRRMRY